MLNENLDELLSKYAIYHSSIAKLGKVQISINYQPRNEVKVVLIQLLEGKEVNQTAYVYFNDFDFKSRILPCFLVSFFEKNQIIEQKNIMGNDNSGTTFIVRGDEKESLTMRNCNKDTMKLITQLYDISKKSKATPTYGKLDILEDTNQAIRKFYCCNLALDYAKHRKDFLDNSGKSNFFDFTTRKSYLEIENRKDEPNLENLIILDLARFAYKIGFGFPNDNYNVWDEIKERYNEPVISRLCDEYKNINYKRNSIYIKALACAELEKNNEGYIMENVDTIMEALESIKNKAYSGSGRFLEYWDSRRRYYKLIGNAELEKICNDFLNSSRLIVDKEIEKKGDVDMSSTKKENIVSKLKEIKQNSRPDFSSIINDPIVMKEEFSSGNSVKDFEKEYLLASAEEQARKIVEVMKEKEQLKKDAEEFAKTILKEQKERRQIVKSAEEQAKKIFELEQENELLRKMAEDNARSIFETDKKFQEELRIREVQVETPIKRADVDKINNLLNSLSSIKEIDFAVNHPTVMQSVILLEEKIVTYLSTHKNIIEEDTGNSKPNIISKKEASKSPEELLTIVRNVYTNSHVYEKEGRHTVINILPVEDKYRVTIYSVKNDEGDILTEVYFDKESFNEDTISELCAIYSKDAVLVASKTDNIPNDLADYLVLDNLDNAIKFTGCPKALIELAKAYL